MLSRFLLISLALFLAPALGPNGGEAHAQGAPRAPVLGDLLQSDVYFSAWQAMLGSETPPAWVTAYTASLNGPPTPNIPVDVDGKTYTMGFTCKPNECGDNQLFALFAPGGTKAWAVMTTPETGLVWLGAPDERIKKAFDAVLDGSPDTP